MRYLGAFDTREGTVYEMECQHCAYQAEMPEEKSKIPLADIYCPKCHKNSVGESVYVPPFEPFGRQV